MKICEHHDTINFNLDNFQIYKDECDKCFKNNLFEKGINLCLICYNSFCEDHLNNHLLKSNHNVYLNIKKKIIRINENEDKPVKLGINQDGGFNDYTKEEFKYKVVCEKCKVCVNEGYENLINEIENSNSAYKEKEIAAWENEVIPCEHSRIKPNYSENKIGVLSNKCHNCDLDKNLWLCLFCGILSCGRKFYDGTGGNNHGIDHYEQTKHPLSIKILAVDIKNSNVSIHCYVCSNDIKDEYYITRLEILGIDINTLTKKEKNIQELNIDANLTLDLNKTFEKNKNLKLVKGKDWTGIKNIGNSCYINSTLQVLFSIEEIKNRYINLFLNHNGNCDKRFCFFCQVSKLFYSLSTGEFCEEGFLIKPFMLKYLVGKDHPEFKTMRQQDVYEYFNHFLSFFDKNEGKDSISNLFKFSFNKIVECNECKFYYLRKNKESKFLEIPILEKIDKEFDFNFKDNLKNIIKNYFENFEEFCMNCNKVCKFNNYFYIKEFPPYLILVFNIYYQENISLKKLNANLKFEDVIDLNILKFNDNFLNKEKEMKTGDENDNQTTDINQTYLTQLLNMGFTENRCKRALIETNNNLENSINFIMSNLDDHSHDLPPNINNNKNNNQEDQKFTKVWNNIKDFGMDKNIVKAAVEIKNSDDSELILNYIMESPEEIENYIKNPKVNENNINLNELKITNNDNGLYQILSSIVHLGKSAHSGHYVSYVKKDNNWVLYNDEKVAIDFNPSIDKSYMIVLKKIDN